MHKENRQDRDPETVVHSAALVAADASNLNLDLFIFSITSDIWKVYWVETGVTNIHFPLKSKDGQSPSVTCLSDVSLPIILKQLIT